MLRGRAGGCVRVTRCEKCARAVPGAARVRAAARACAGGARASRRVVRLRGLSSLVYLCTAPLGARAPPALYCICSVWPDTDGFI